MRNNVRKENWIIVYKIFDALEGQDLETILKEHNIPVVIVPRQDSAFDGIFKSSIGEGVLKVREDYLEEAKKIIDSFETERRRKGKGAYEDLKTQRVRFYREYKKKYKNLYFIVNAIAVIILITILVFVAKAVFTSIKYNKLLVEYGKVIQHDSGNEEAYWKRGNIYRIESNLDLAISDYSKVIEINPKNYKAYNNRGSIYLVKGNFNQAISDFNKAIEINPNSPDSYHNRALAYFYKKEYSRCWEDVHKVEILGKKVEGGFIKALQKASGRKK